jgi:hypothetical protein
MRRKTKKQEPRRELAHRTGDGIEVQLLWSPTNNTVSLAVYDHREGVGFEREVARDRALHAFHHPYVYVGGELDDDFTHVAA